MSNGRTRITCGPSLVRRWSSFVKTKLLSILVLLGAVSAGPAGALPSYADRGRAIMTLINRDLWMPKQQLYAQKVAPKLSADFAWGSGVQLSALTAAARVDRATYFPILRKYIDGLDAYWVVAPSPLGNKRIGGYDVLPHPGSADRYYDDNAWIALGLIEAYDLSRDPKDLARAKATVAFVLSGEDQKLGGGLYWREQKLESKNTCANAPGILAALRLYQITHDPALLTTAKRLYGWTKANLQGKDGTYYDNIKIEPEKVEKVALTYNSALMIRDECTLYDITRDRTHLTEAARIADSGIKRWVNPDTGAIRDRACFAHLFAESLLELSDRDHNQKWAGVDHAALDFLWQHNREPSGFYPDHWDTSDPPDEPAELIREASAARAYFRAAWK
jgi:hypothetical protein